MGNCSSRHRKRSPTSLPGTYHLDHSPQHTIHGPGTSTNQPHPGEIYETPDTQAPGTVIGTSRISEDDNVRALPPTSNEISPTNTTPDPWNTHLSWLANPSTSPAGDIVNAPIVPETGSQPTSKYIIGSPTVPERGSQSTLKEITSSPAIAEPDSRYLNGGYWASWKQAEGIKPSSVPMSSLTHIHYAFADVDIDGTVYLKDEHTHYEAETDEVNGGLRAWTQRKTVYPGMKMTLAVGGGEPNVADTFAAVANNPERRLTFVESTGYLLKTFELDGVDVDWVSPKDAVEAANYLQLLTELRASLGGHVWISIVLPADMILLEHYNLAELANVVTFVNLVMFDFVIPMADPVDATGHHAQLFATREDGNHGYPCGSDLVHYVASRGVPRSKIMLGVPLYGRTFKGADAMDQRYEGPGSGEDATYPVSQLPPRSALEMFDRLAVAAYSSGNGEFISYDNAESVAKKAKFVKQLGLRGLFYWHLSEDRHGDASLVKRGFEALSASTLED